MAIAAGENAIHQIIAALDQISVGPRAAECDGKCEDACNYYTEQSSSPRIPRREYTGLQQGGNSVRCGTDRTNRRSYCGVIPASLAASRMFS
jgi:hypothetical protein